MLKFTLVYYRHTYSCENNGAFVQKWHYKEKNYLTLSIPNAAKAKQEARTPSEGGSLALVCEKWDGAAKVGAAELPLPSVRVQTVITSSGRNSVHRRTEPRGAELSWAERLLG